MKRETTELAQSIPATIENSVDTKGLTAAATAATPTAPAAAGDTTQPAAPGVQPAVGGSAGANGSAPRVASKSDPFADLAELEDVLDPTDTGSRN
jgi:hypothetical protein